MKAAQRPRAIAVLREPVFSPGMVEHDAAILRASAAELGKRHQIACAVVSIDEAVALEGELDLVLAMAEGDDSLGALEGLERRGAVVINAPRAVRATRREALLALGGPGGSLLDGVLVDTATGVVQSAFGTESVWIKRADYHALGPGDVTRVAASEVAPTLRAMRSRGIGRAVIQPHLDGPVVKFYGVANARPFFRPFPLEAAPRPAAHDLQLLETRAFQAARAAGLVVFGGDAVLTANGPVLIDLNAWPSFWRCLADAAVAIADHAASRLGARPSFRVA